MAGRSLLRRNLALCTLDGIVATPIVYLLQPGNFIIAALLTGAFHLPNEIYGVIVSLPFWGNFAQAFFMPFINQHAPPKRVTVICAGLQALCWAALAISLGYLPPGVPAESSRWFVALFVISAGLTALTAVSWTSWMQEWVPLRLRGKYFGRRNRALQIAQVLFLLGVGQLLGRTTNSIHAFQALLVGSVALRVASVWIQHRIQAGAGELRDEAKLPWADQLRVLRESPAFLWFVAYGALWGFAANVFGPFYPVFLYQQLGWTPESLTWLVVLNCIGGALSYPAWGMLADRFGNKPVMFFCMVVWQALNFSWCFLTPQNSWLLYSLWTLGGVVGAGGMAGVGFLLTFFNIQLKIIPPEAKTLAVSLNLAVTSLVTAIAPIIGGAVIDHFLRAGFDPTTLYHRIFLVQPTLAILSCALILRIHEAEASPLTSVVGAMRNWRTLSAVLGLSFIVDFIFVKPQKKS